MNWKTIRLELARTPDFPAGSAGRAYLLRLPLAEDGGVDEAEVRQFPLRATARRFWPNQPDLAGSVIRTPAGWALRWENVACEPRPLPPCPLSFCEGHSVVLTEPDGSRLPFRVARVSLLT